MFATLVAVKHPVIFTVFVVYPYESLHTDTVRDVLRHQ